MTEKERKSVVVLPLPVADLGKLEKVLNKCADDGYSLQHSLHIPAKDGGIVVLFLGDVHGGVAEVESDDPEDVTATPKNGNGKVAEVTVLRDNGPTKLPEPSIVEEA